jgi:gluconolactonase
MNHHAAVVTRLSAALGAACIAGATVLLCHPARSQPATAGAHRPEKLVDIPHFCEGIAFDAAGRFYVSDLEEGTIYRVTDERRITPWARTGRPNGHKILPDGTHLICDAAAQALLRLDKNGRLVGKASSGWNGQPLLGPNDVTLDGRGGIYFSDPEGSGIENPVGAVYYVDTAGVTHRVAHGLAYPNGLVVRPDGKTLLVAEGERNRILSYDILAPGKVGPMRVLIDLPEKSGDQIDNHADGMALDTAGNLYVAHYGMGRIQVVRPDGTLARSLEAGNMSCSNVAFGGPDMNRLYITGAVREHESPGAVFLIELPGVRGVR